MDGYHRINRTVDYIADHNSPQQDYCIIEYLKIPRLRDRERSKPCNFLKLCATRMFVL
jgi:hypothetical protein